MTEKTRSNYDRWKPGIKLACMMALKRVCTDPSFYDAVNHKFNSMTWHSVAEHLNKEYPDYAKRFTNINVKDRYDRVLKHHKVFVRMSNQLSGFVWNPKTFSFDLNDKLIKEYEENVVRNDKVIRSDLGIVRFLSKPGHIDLEYFHRYIYQVQNEEELRNDSVLNSPSFIEDAINKGILSNLSTRPSIFSNSSNSESTNSSSSTLGSTSNTANIHKNIINNGNQNNSNNSTNTNSTANNNTTNNLHNNQQTSSLPELNTNNSSGSSLSIPSNTSPLNNSITASGGLLQPSIPPPLQLTHQLPHYTQVTQSQIPQPFALPHNILHPSNPQHPPHHNHQELDFSGLMDNQQGNFTNIPMNIHSNAHHDNDPNKLDSLHARKRLRTGVIQTGLLVEGYTDSLNNPNSVNQQQQLPTNSGLKPGSGSATHHQIGIPINQPNNMIISGNNNGLSTGEAVLQIHKGLEIMENSVIEAVLSLRVNKLISHEDFEKVDELLQDNNGVFIRSAYSRLGDNSKLLELINIYLNKLD